MESDRTNWGSVFGKGNTGLTSAKTKALFHKEKIKEKEKEKEEEEEKEKGGEEEEKKGEEEKRGGSPSPSY